MVFFSIHTIHGSALNRKPTWRRVMRLGYRDPHNRQLSGQGYGRPGLMVHGLRPKLDDTPLSVYGDSKQNEALAAQRDADAQLAKDLARPQDTTFTLAGVERLNPYGNWGAQAQPLRDDD